MITFSTSRCLFRLQSSCDTIDSEHALSMEQGVGRLTGRLVIFMLVALSSPRLVRSSANFRMLIDDVRSQDASSHAAKGIYGRSSQKLPPASKISQFHKVHCWVKRKPLTTKTLIPNIDPRHGDHHSVRTSNDRRSTRRSTKRSKP